MSSRCQPVVKNENFLLLQRWLIGIERASRLPRQRNRQFFIPFGGNVPWSYSFLTINLNNNISEKKSFSNQNYSVPNFCSALKIGRKVRGDAPPPREALVCGGGEVRRWGGGEVGRWEGGEVGRWGGSLPSHRLRCGAPLPMHLIFALRWSIGGLKEVFWIVVQDVV